MTSMQPKDLLGVAKERAPYGLTAASDGTARAWSERPRRADSLSRPLLMVDIDGVISLFAGAERWRDGAEEGSFHSIEGMPHFLSATAAAHLLALSEHFDLIWASGWEERADEHLPHLLGLPAGLPFLRFERAVGRANAHWKLDAIDRYAGGRPLAWIDDALGPACEQWAARRGAPTLLVQTEPHLGLTAAEARRLTEWARSLPAG
jgi:HAD domain in Swiss Army Knife RNA repair proteins